ncbi:hypothetical protein [Niallia sp. 03133]
MERRELERQAIKEKRKANAWRITGWGVHLITVAPKIAEAIQFFKDFF